MLSDDPMQTVDRFKALKVQIFVHYIKRAIPFRILKTLFTTVGVPSKDTLLFLFKNLFQYQTLDDQYRFLDFNMSETTQGSEKGICKLFEHLTAMAAYIFIHIYCTLSKVLSYFTLNHMLVFYKRLTN